MLLFFLYGHFDADSNSIDKEDAKIIDDFIEASHFNPKSLDIRKNNRKKSEHIIKEINKSEYRDLFQGWLKITAHEYFLILNNKADKKIIEHIESFISYQRAVEIINLIENNASPDEIIQAIEEIPIEKKPKQTTKKQIRKKIKLFVFKITILAISLIIIINKRNNFIDKKEDTESKYESKLTTELKKKSKEDLKKIEDAVVKDAIIEYKDQRELVRTFVHNFINAAKKGENMSSIIYGPAGSGKTALFTQVCKSFNKVAQDYKIPKVQVISMNANQMKVAGFLGSKIDFVDELAKAQSGNNHLMIMLDETTKVWEQSKSGTGFGKDRYSTLLTMSTGSEPVIRGSTGSSLHTKGLQFFFTGVTSNEASIDKTVEADQTSYPEIMRRCMIYKIDLGNRNLKEKTEKCFNNIEANSDISNNIKELLKKKKAIIINILKNTTYSTISNFFTNLESSAYAITNEVEPNKQEEKLERYLIKQIGIADINNEYDIIEMFSSREPLQKFVKSSITNKYIPPINDNKGSIDLSIVSTIDTDNNLFICRKVDSANFVSSDYICKNHASFEEFEKNTNKFLHIIHLSKNTNDIKKQIQQYIEMKIKQTTLKGILIVPLSKITIKSIVEEYEKSLIVNVNII